MYQDRNIGNSATGLSSGSALASGTKPELMDYMDRLAQAIACAEDLSSQLQARLSGVMSPPSPCEAVSGKNPGAMSFYGQQVDAAIDRIGGVNSSMRNILDRLQA